jgi:hypothetical protein
MFISLFQLTVESSTVIGLRTAKFLRGDNDACYESRLMISEKVDAAFEAASGLIAGASPYTIIDQYRQHVTANAERLSSKTDRHQSAVGNRRTANSI